jgi:hypothetical protein
MAVRTQMFTVIVWTQSETKRKIKRSATNEHPVSNNDKSHSGDGPNASHKLPLNKCNTYAVIIIFREINKSNNLKIK